MAVVVLPTPPFWLATAMMRPKVSLTVEGRQDSTRVTRLPRFQWSAGFCLGDPRRST